MEILVKLTLDPHGNLISVGSNCQDKNVLIGLLSQACIVAAANGKNGGPMVETASPAVGRMLNGR